MAHAPFAGLNSGALAFLRELGAHNSRAWFSGQRRRYEEHLVAPLRSLVLDLAPAMLELDPGLETAPAVGKAISRIHRDTRFSPDKSPYRDHMWIAFANPAVPGDRPAFFFEFGPRVLRYGMGFYGAGKAKMDWVRGRIDATPAEFAAAVAPLAAAGFRLVVHRAYARSRAGHLPAPLQPWYNAMSLHVEAPLDEPDLYGPDLVGRLAGGFRLLAPLYRFLRGEVPEAELPRFPGPASRRPRR